DLGNAAATFAFIGPDERPMGFGRVHFVPRPATLASHRILVADTPGFRVAIVSRSLPGGGFVGLWSGDPDLVDEIAAYLREEVRACGLSVPEPAPSVPALTGISSEQDVWRQATSLRA